VSELSNLSKLSCESLLYLNILIESKDTPQGDT